MADGISYKIRIEGARETLAAFREMPKDATTELRKASLKIAESLAVQLRGVAAGDSAQTALMAPTIKAMRDRLPAVQAGGSNRAGAQSRRSKGQRPTQAGDILFGSEFGARFLKQYRPHRGAASYWFFKTVQDEEGGRIAREWDHAADEIIRKWGGSH